MSSFKKLLILSAMVAVGFALTVRDGDHPRCSGAKLIASTTIHAGGYDIVETTHYCPPPPIERRQTAPTNVCGTTYTTSCNHLAGILPPISQDCQAIADSIEIMADEMSPTFVIQPGHIVTLSFNTCKYFVENLCSDEIEFCWSDLSNLGGAAGAACFPPVQPFFPEGLCTAYDGTWAAGASHT